MGTRQHAHAGRRRQQPATLRRVATAHGIASAGRPERAGHDGTVSTRTLIVLAAVCAVAILAASAIQILMAR
jgi:hypothetical protein